MKDALKNFSAITLAILICLILAWIWLRGRALAQPIKKPMEHPFLSFLTSQTGPTIVAHRGGWNERPENTRAAFEHAANLDPNIVIWADIRPTKDGTLVVFRDRDLLSTTETKGWIAYESDAVVFAADPGSRFKNAQGERPYLGQKILTLETLLSLFPKHRFVLNFRDYRPGMDETVTRIIEAQSASSRVLITSPEDGFLRDLREKNPRWIFGTSRAEATRMRMMDSIGLAPVAKLRGDVFVLEAEGNRSALRLLSRSIVAEIHRRGMKVIAGPAQETSDFIHLREAGVDAILTSRPGEATTRSAFP